MVSQFLEYEYSSEIKGCAVARPYIQSFAGENTFDLRRKKVHNPTLPTKKAFSEAVPIKASKIEDLRKTLQYIPPQNLPFYNNIIENWPQATNVDDEQ